MLEALEAIGPLFAVLAVGGLASFLPQMREAESSLTAFVLYFALPAFLFTAVATAPVNDGVPWTFIAIAFGATSVVSVLTWTIGRLSGSKSRTLAEPLALSASYGNVGYLGVPIALSILGPEAGLAAAMGSSSTTLCSCSDTRQCELCSPALPTVRPWPRSSGRRS